MKEWKTKEQKWIGIENNEGRIIGCVTWKNTKLSDFQRVWHSLSFG